MPQPDLRPDDAAARASRAPLGGLTEQERAVLDLEAATWRHTGAKDHAIRERLGLAPTAYYQVLNGLLDREAALAYRPPPRPPPAAHARHPATGDQEARDSLVHRSRFPRQEN